MRYFLSVIAMVLIIEGIPYFMFPAKFKILIRIIEQMEESHLRLTGLIMIILGLIVLYLSVG